MNKILKNKIACIFSPTSQQKPWCKTDSLQYPKFYITLYCVFFATLLLLQEGGGVA
jgi:hypothetical protein